MDFTKGYNHCMWELKNLKKKPVFVWSLSPFWIGYNLALAKNAFMCYCRLVSNEINRLDRLK